MTHRIGFGEMKQACCHNPDGVPQMGHAESSARSCHNGEMRQHGYEPTREAAMAAFAKSWRRE
jgi:hypothetical protein